MAVDLLRPVFARQRNSVHVAVAYRLGEKLGDEAQPRNARNDANRAGYDRHHSGERDSAVRISGGERRRHAQNDCRQRRIGSKHQNSAGAEERVGEQGYDGRIEATDAGQARGDGVCDADRDQHCRENQPRSEVTRKPTRLIAAQRRNSRKPAEPAWPRKHRGKISQIPKLIGVRIEDAGPLRSIWSIAVELIGGRANWVEFALGAATLATILSIKTFKGLPGILVAMVGATAIVQVFDLHTRAQFPCSDRFRKGSRRFRYPGSATKISRPQRLAASRLRSCRLPTRASCRVPTPPGLACPSIPIRK